MNKVNKVIADKLDKLKYQESVFISQDNTLPTAIVRAEIAVLEEVRDEIT